MYMFRIIIIITLTLLAVQPMWGGDKPSANQALIDKGSEYVNSGNLDNALDIYLGMIGKLKDEKDLSIHVNVYNDLGVIYRRRNMNDSAIYYYDKALDTAVKLDDKEWIATLSINLGVFYHNLQHFEEASRYADMAVKYSKLQADESLHFFACQIASSLKVEVKDCDLALRYAREAWAMADGSGGNDDMRLRCIPSLAVIFDAKGQTDSVFHYIDIGSRLVKDCDNDITRIGFIQSRSEFCYRHGRWRDALRDMHVLTRSSGTLNAPLYRKMAECYRHLGEPGRAYCYMDTARMWTDSLSAKDIETKLAEFHVKYESKEKEMQLAEERRQHAEQQVKWMIAALVASLLVAVLVVVLLVLHHRHKLHLMFVRQCAEISEARQYIEGLETERSRMARELHDSVSNGLLGVSLKMQGAKTPDDLRGVVADVERLRGEVRTLSHGMMPPEFSKHTLNEILDLFVSGIRGGNVSYAGSGADCWRTLSKDVSFEVFRIAQECIANSLSHSGGDIIRVSLATSEDGLHGILKVEDDGIHTSSPDGDGIGIRVMQERVKTIGGHIDIRSHSDGTAISIIFPI